MFRDVPEIFLKSPALATSWVVATHKRRTKLFFFFFVVVSGDGVVDVIGVTVEDVVLLVVVVVGLKTPRTYCSHSLNSFGESTKKRSLNSLFRLDDIKLFDPFSAVDQFPTIFG